MGFDVPLKPFLPPILHDRLVGSYSQIKGSELQKKGFNAEKKEPFIHSRFNSFSGPQHEDLLVDYLLGFPKKGFYVDVGANDPDFLGHTQRFYNKGWRGINIEPQKKLWHKLNKKRAEDINLCLAVANESGTKTFYSLPHRNDGSSLNLTMAELNSSWHHAEIQPIEVSVQPLSALFTKYLKTSTIDFMSVDVEGYELSVLESNDWDRFRPTLLIVEIAHFNNNKIISYLKKQGYTLLYNNYVNGIFMDQACI